MILDIPIGSLGLSEKAQRNPDKYVSYRLIKVIDHCTIGQDLAKILTRFTFPFKKNQDIQDTSRFNRYVVATPFVTPSDAISSEPKVIIMCPVAGMLEASWQMLTPDKWFAELRKKVLTRSSHDTISEEFWNSII